ncbi:MAG: butyrate kinase [candidate division WOR-3 bacterium]
MLKVLVINPGSSSTKLGFYAIEKKKYKTETELNSSVKTIWENTIRHPVEILKRFKNIFDQLAYRKTIIEENIKNQDFDAIATRGGPLKPLARGIYRITQKVVDDIYQGKTQSQHVSLLGPIISYELSTKYKVPAYFVDPESVDEFIPIAYPSGLPEIPRKSLSHYLNIHAVSKKAAAILKKPVTRCNFIVAHLGSGITIAAKQRGRQIDANNANEDGPFAPQRTGSLPLGGVVDLCYSGKYTKEEMLKKIQNFGGLLAYLGTDNLKEVLSRIKKGDRYASLIYEAMIYQIAKEIGAMYIALKGQVDAIVISGGLAYESKFITDLKKWLNCLNKQVLVLPGEEEMHALASGVFSVLLKKEKLKIYR